MDLPAEWPAPPPARPRVGVSACLMGASVRFDGGHKADAFVRALREHVELVVVCPEVELGLGTPRESLRLVRLSPGLPRLVAPRSDRDLTEEMRAFATGRVGDLVRSDLDGFVVKRASPSCGLERVRVYDANGVPSRDGRGLFTQALLEALPRLPVEEEGRLHDPPLRDNFLARVWAHLRLRRLMAASCQRRTLVAFHTQAKLQLLAHGQERYRALGRLVAGATGSPLPEQLRQYHDLYLDTLAVVPRVGQHVNVLEHMAGHLRERAARSERHELAEAIADYRAGYLPRAVPLALLRHQARRHQISYLLVQTYLDPYPKELMRAAV